MPTISTLTAVLELDKDGFESGLKGAQDDLDGLAGRAQRTGERLTSVGKSMTAGITAPLVAMGALSARAAANFDQAMQRSIAVMGDVDEAMRKRLEERAREVANTTTHSAEQAAQSYYYLASAGLDAQQAIEAMPQVAAFAEAGNLQMAEATDVATNVMSAFNYEASEMSEVTDTLTATVSNHNQTMQDMSTAMSKVAPIASSLGISIEEASAAIGQMGDVGIQGERAGTALRNVLSQISDESSPVTKRLQEMGVQTRDAQGNVLSLAQILENMEKAGVEASDAARIFGTEAGPAMAALISEGSGALEQNAQRLREAEGATEDMAQTQRDTLNAELQITRSNLEDVGITLGSQLLPMLSTATGHIKGAAQQFQNLNEDQQRAILVAGGLAASLGPILVMAGLLAQSIVALSGAYGVLTTAKASLAAVNYGAVIPSLTAVNGLLSPILLPIYALIAASGALAAAWAADWGNIRQWTEEGAGVIGKIIEWLIQQINKLPKVKIETEDIEGKLRDMVNNAEDATDDAKQALNEHISDPFGLQGSSESGMQPDILDDQNGMPSPEEVGLNKDAFGEQGKQAGQEFGQSFGQSASSSIVESLSVDDIQSRLEKQLAEAEKQRAEATGEEYMRAREEVQKLQDQLEQVRSADTLADVDQDVAADVAESKLTQKKEEAKAIQGIYAELENRDLDVEGNVDPSKFDEISVDSESQIKRLMANSSTSGDSTDTKTKKDRTEKLLEQIATRIDQLPQEINGTRLRLEASNSERALRDLIREVVDEVIVEGSRT
ncbi:phage tail tape measure protein [Halopiger thermotolerans]